jgi:hypothetical protein
VCAVHISCQLDSPSVCSTCTLPAGQPSAHPGILSPPLLHTPCQLFGPTVCAHTLLAGQTSSVYTHPASRSHLYCVHTPCHLVRHPVCTHTLPAGHTSIAYTHPAIWSDIQCVHTPCRLFGSSVCTHNMSSGQSSPVYSHPATHTHTAGQTSVCTQLETPCQKTSASFDTLAALIQAGIQSLYLTKTPPLPSPPSSHMMP